MTREVAGIDRNESVQQAAQKMASLAVGVLPVFQDGQPVGMVTDRDITIRATAEGKDPAQTPVSAVMTPDPVVVTDETDTTEAARLMEERQVRRLLVKGPDERIVGIVSLGDLAVRGGDRALCGEVAEQVSQPAQPVR